MVRITWQESPEHLSTHAKTFDKVKKFYMNFIWIPLPYGHCSLYSPYLIKVWPHVQLYAQQLVTLVTMAIRLLIVSLHFLPAALCLLCTFWNHSEPHWLVSPISLLALFFFSFFFFKHSWTSPNLSFHFSADGPIHSLSEDVYVYYNHIWETFRLTGNWELNSDFSIVQKLIWCNLFCMPLVSCDSQDISVTREAWGRMAFSTLHENSSGGPTHS